ncbi:MAG: hypothetical protein AB7I19_02735 [Planctomycetota bacterium]
MVRSIVLRGLTLSSAALLFACSGTQGPATPDTAPNTAGGSAVGHGGNGGAAVRPLTPSPGIARLDLASYGVASGEQDKPQDPPAQVGQERRRLLIQDGLDRARRALEYRLYADALRESTQVLELDETNEEARTILLSVQEILGDDTARVARTFDSKVLEARVAQERTRFRVRQLTQQADAELELGRYADAIEHYYTALRQLQIDAFSTPGTDLEKEIQRKYEMAQQRRAEAMQKELADEQSRSRAELEEAERRRRLEREQRVSRLLVQANQDFQNGHFGSAESALQQAATIDPNNAEVAAFLDLASRANHESKLDVARQRWKEQWIEAFDEINRSLLPQTETVVYDLQRWSYVLETRKPREFTPAEAMEASEDRAVRQILDSVSIEHHFSSATLRDWARHYQDATNVNVVIAPSATEAGEEATTLTDFHLANMPVSKALNVIAAQTGLKWHVRDGVVEIVSAATPIGRAYLKQYEVRDIVQGIRNQPGPQLRLTVPGSDDGGLGLDEEDPLPSVVDDGTLTTLIQSNIAAESWTEGNTINFESGVLLVRNTREVHEQIERLLGQLRQSVGIQVDIEARFLKVEDSFLEDIGVDFRGLGDQSSEGRAGRGLERNNRSNLRFDDFGRAEQINSAAPGQIGSGTEPGVFFDDGGDGDIMGRTEHLYDRALGGRQGGLDNSGGLSLQYAYLDDTELQLILRAVSKQERSEEIVAPRLLVFNNTRAHMQALRSTSYISDFGVEIAQAAAVANPVVGVVRDGVVLDVRPVVSADRRFITMELRPTVMTLQLPIPTFTTTLGAGQPVSIQLPVTNLQSVRTTVTMPDGGSILLGGMKLAERQNQVSGVPILKDLPGLSLLFSRKGSYVLNRKIIILIRARIILAPEFEPGVLPDAVDTLLSTR